MEVVEVLHHYASAVQHRAYAIALEIPPKQGHGHHYKRFNPYPPPAHTAYCIICHKREKDTPQVPRGQIGGDSYKVVGGVGVEHRSPVDACTGEKLPEQIYARETTETQAKEERPGHQQQVDFTNQETAERLVGIENRAEQKKKAGRYMLRMVL